MRILLFGGTGKSGQQIIQQALQQGHTVTAFIRTSSKLPFKNSNLFTFKGNVFDKKAVFEAMEGQEAVISTLGENRKDKRKLSEGTQNIIEVMEAQGVKRLIYMTSLGVGDSKHLGGFLFMKIIVPLFLKDVMIDKALQEDKITETSLDWTIVRPAGLTNDAKKGNYVINFTKKDDVNLRIARADVADFMLKNLESKEFLKQKVTLSYSK